MKIIKSILILLIIVLACLLPSSPSEAGDLSNVSLQGRLKPQDYLFAPGSDKNNDLFESLKPVEAGVDLGVGSDCGKINIQGTLNSTFGKVLSGDYFKGLAQDIVGSAPMLAACYMSPTWCSILKHTQLSAGFLTQTRLNQCQIIDKYVDSRTEDYYRERQNCVHRAIQANGGDMESALGSCQGGVFEGRAGNWAGASKDDPNHPNALIDDSARWAGFDGAEGGRITQLVKSFVGDTVLMKGNVHVEYGSKAHPYSPRSYLLSLEQNVNHELCDKLLPELAQRQYVGDAELVKRLQKLPSAPTEEENQTLTPELVRNLAYVPTVRRGRMCLKLSQMLALNTFNRDLSRSLDVLSAAAQNPNLPPNRRQEIESKRTSLKDQVDLTLRLRQEQSKPMGEVMQYISQEGMGAQDEATRTTLDQDSAVRTRLSHSQRMNDCADGVFCSSDYKNPN